MPAVRVVLPESAAAFSALREELGVVEPFPVAALEEARDAAAHPRLPTEDLTALPFLTIDPPGSLDLDQAMHLAAEGRGIRLRYAIADLSSFVVPGGALDVELRRRGETLYAPDCRVPLHPPVLGEDAASLLPGVVRPAVVWDLLLDATGEPERVDVRRALVRSRRRLDYAGAQAELEAGTADLQLQLLREVGRLRLARSAGRGALDLPSLEQEVELGPTGPVLSLRAPLPVEGWNAQVSLLTGSTAARTMLAGGVGLLRTMPDPDPADVAGLRRSALALGLPWPEGTSYATAVSALDPHEPRAAALLVLAARLLRGAGYTAFAEGSPPEQTTHSAVAGPYAHATAPLRRLADRYVLQTCVALHAGDPVPDDVRAALPELPAVMTAADRAAHALDRAGIDLAEALVLAPRTGERFPAEVVESGAKHGVVQLRDPAVRARCDAPDLVLGARIEVVLVTADPATRTVLFRPA